MAGRFVSLLDRLFRRRPREKQMSRDIAELKDKSDATLRRVDEMLGDGPVDELRRTEDIARGEGRRPWPS